MQTLRRSAILLAFCFASLQADDLESKFRKALLHHRYDEAITLVRQGFVLADALFDDGSSPLCLAARDESADGFDLALELVDNGAPVDRTCADGLRPLHWAAQAGNLGVVDLLVRNGADVSPESRPAHYTPLYLALSYGNGRVADYLERQGATIPPVVRMQAEAHGRVAKAVQDIGPSPFPLGPDADLWGMLRVLEIEQAYGEFKDDPHVTRMMTELRALLEANPKPDGMDFAEWLLMHGETAKRIALKEVR